MIGAEQRLDNGDSLGDRLERLKTFADRVPVHARPRVAIAIDKLALLLGEVVAETDPDADANH